MRHYITERCHNFKDNKHQMLNSALSRPKRKIVLDRVVQSTPDGDSELVTDPDKINQITVQHFQTYIV